jgi:hypothetical protein
MNLEQLREALAVTNRFIVRRGCPQLLQSFGFLGPRLGVAVKFVYSCFVTKTAIASQSRLRSNSSQLLAELGSAHCHSR